MCMYIYIYVYAYYGTACLGRDNEIIQINGSLREGGLHNVTDDRQECHHDEEGRRHFTSHRVTSHHVTSRHAVCIRVNSHIVMLYWF